MTYSGYLRVVASLKHDLNKKINYLIYINLVPNDLQFVYFSFPKNSCLPDTQEKSLVFGVDLIISPIQISQHRQ